MSHILFRAKLDIVLGNRLFSFLVRNPLLPALGSSLGSDGMGGNPPNQIRYVRVENAPFPDGFASESDQRGLTSRFKADPPSISISPIYRKEPSATINADSRAASCTTY